MAENKTPPAVIDILGSIPVLNIGGHPIELEVQETSLTSEPNTWGMFIPQQGRIVLDSRQTEASMVNTLLHEVLHACVMTSGVDVPAQVEEVLVRVITNHLAGVFLQNPKLCGLMAAAAVRAQSIFAGEGPDEERPETPPEAVACGPLPEKESPIGDIHG